MDNSSLLIKRSLKENQIGVGIEEMKELANDEL